MDRVNEGITAPESFDAVTSDNGIGGKADKYVICIS